MKKVFVLGLILACIMSITLVVTGCEKTTGGGAFYDTYSYDEFEGPPTLDYYTFGFNAQPVGLPYGEPIVLDSITIQQQDAKGQLTLINHTQNFKIKVDFDGTCAFVDEIPDMPEGMSAFIGTGMARSQGMGNEVFGPFTLFVGFLDSTPDRIMFILGEGDIYAYIAGDQDAFDIYVQCEGELEPGSDIVVH